MLPAAVAVALVGARSIDGLRQLDLQLDLKNTPMGPSWRQIFQETQCAFFFDFQQRPWWMVAGMMTSKADADVIGRMRGDEAETVALMT